MDRTFDSQTKEATSVPESRRNSTSNSSIGTANNCLNIQHYFRYSANKETDKREGRLLRMKIHNEFKDIFTGICCLKDTFKLQVGGGSHPYQV